VPTESFAPFKNTRNRKVLAALEGNWQAEMEGYYTYLALANRETDAVRAQVLRHLASAELEHAALWASRIVELGGAEPVYSGSPNGDADSFASRAGGPIMALRRLEIEENRHIANYGTQLKELGDEGSIAILEHVIEDEKDHYRELGSLLRGRSHLHHSGKHVVDAKGMLEELLAKRNQGRSQAGGWIGDAIYGVNDGLGAIFGIVSGVSGATAAQSSQTQAHFVLLAGLAGMIASALSMGSGAYLAAKSEREIYEAELEREREAINMNPSEARQLLSLYYQVKGSCRRAPLDQRRRTQSALGFRHFGSAFDRSRRNHPGNPVLFHVRNFCCNHRRGYFADRALRCGSGQIADHGSLLVGQRI